MDIADVFFKHLFASKHSGAMSFLASQLGSIMSRTEVILKFFLGFELLPTARLQARDRFFFLVNKSPVSR